MAAVYAVEGADGQAGGLRQAQVFQYGDMLHGFQLGR
jgi:hypothetical protein